MLVISKTGETAYTMTALKQFSADELKHDPLALVTDEMPVATIARNDALRENLSLLLSNATVRRKILRMARSKRDAVRPISGRLSEAQGAPAESPCALAPPDCRAPENRS